MKDIIQIIIVELTRLAWRRLLEGQTARCLCVSRNLRVISYLVPSRVGGCVISHLVPSRVGRGWKVILWSYKNVVESFQD